MNFDILNSEGRSPFKRRVDIIVWVVVGVLLIYVAHLFDLQVIHGIYYQKRSYDLARRATPIPARRGEIFDRNYDVPLATNRPSYAIDLIPGEVHGATLDQVVSRLADLLQVSKSSLDDKLTGARTDPYQLVEMQSGVALDTITYVAEHIEDFPGVSWHSKPTRFYPITGSISHIVGYVGDITPAELQVLYNQGYSSDSVLGKDGVEKIYDATLRGKDGEMYQSVDAQGRLVNSSNSITVPPVDGKNIVLTIDRHIQRLAQDALGPRTGSIVVLRPATGEVLALVSYPWYNANMFYTKEGRQELRKVFLDPKFPFVDRAIQSVYAPASTFKIVMATADVETNVLPPTEGLDIKPSMDFGGRIWHNWTPVEYPAMTLAEGLAQSNDVYFWTLGQKYLGIDRIDDFSERFGLGKKTGIDLPGEVAGLVPSPQWKERELGAPWLGGDTMNMSIGQGNLLVTPLQMADVVAMVANHGTIYRPHVLKEIRDPATGAILQEVKPEVLEYSGMSASTFDQVAEAMRGVIKFGTANVVITTKAVKIAGKTGTGQVGSEDRFTSWFVSYGPYNAKNPDDEVVVVVMVDANNPWEWWAPKAASIIYQGIFAHEDYEQAVKSLEPVWYLDSSVVGSFDR